MLETAFLEGLHEPLKTRLHCPGPPKPREQFPLGSANPYLRLFLQRGRGGDARKTQAPSRFPEPREAPSQECRRWAGGEVFLGLLSL